MGSGGYSSARKHSRRWACSQRTHLSGGVGGSGEGGGEAGGGDSGGEGGGDAAGLGGGEYDGEAPCIVPPT